MRVWAPRGRRPTAWVHRRYDWLYVYAVVRPTTGQSWWALLPTVSAEAFGVALAEFAHDEGIDATHRAAIALDGAGWHAAQALVVPNGIDLVPLPPTSPELQPAAAGCSRLQPAERLSPLTDEVVANRTFVDLEELEDVLVRRCRTLRANRRQITGHTRYHWWPRERRPGRRRKGLPGFRISRPQHASPDLKAVMDAAAH